MQTQEELDQILVNCRASEAPTNPCKNDPKKRLCKEIPYYECQVMIMRDQIFKDKPKPKTAEEMVE